MPHSLCQLKDSCSLSLTCRFVFFLESMIIKTLELKHLSKITIVLVNTFLYSVQNSLIKKVPWQSVENLKRYLHVDSL